MTRTTRVDPDSARAAVLAAVRDLDGATVRDVLLESLAADRLAWLVPGWRLEKITALPRELPERPGDRRRRVRPLDAGVGDQDGDRKAALDRAGAAIRLGGRAESVKTRKVAP